MGQSTFFDFCKGSFILTMISLNPAFNKGFSEATDSSVGINLSSCPAMWNRQAANGESPACLIKVKFFFHVIHYLNGKVNSTAQSRVSYMLQSHFNSLYDRMTAFCVTPLSDISLHRSARFTSSCNLYRSLVTALTNFPSTGMKYEEYTIRNHD